MYVEKIGESGDEVRSQICIFISQVNLVLSLEAKFACIHHGSVPRILKVRNGKRHRWLMWFKRMLQGEDFSSAEHISSTLNPSKVYY